MFFHFFLSCLSPLRDHFLSLFFNPRNPRNPLFITPENSTNHARSCKKASRRTPQKQLILGHCRAKTRKKVPKSSTATPQNSSKTPLRASASRFFLSNFRLNHARSCKKASFLTPKTSHFASFLRKKATKSAKKPNFHPQKPP